MRSSAMTWVVFTPPLLHGNAEQMPFANESFDLAISQGAANRRAADLLLGVEQFEELARRLDRRSGGEVRQVPVAGNQDCPGNGGKRQ